MLFMAPGAVLTVQRGTRSYCLLHSLSSQTSHLCSGLAAGEELQPGGHAWERRSGEEIQKGRSWLRRASSDCVANAMAFKMLKEGQLVPYSASSASPADAHLGFSPTQSHQTRNDGPRSREDMFVSLRCDKLRSVGSGWSV